MDIDREAIKAEFARLFKIEAIHKSTAFKMLNNDQTKFDPLEMPPTERIDAINEACKAALRKNK